MEVFLQEVRLGDRSRRAPGWLVVYKGALRGILSRTADDEMVLTVACDRRLHTDPPIIFRGLIEARAWLTRRLEGLRPRRHARPVQTDTAVRLYSAFPPRGAVEKAREDGR